MKRDVKCLGRCTAKEEFEAEVCNYPCIRAPHHAGRCACGNHPIPVLQKLFVMFKSTGDEEIDSLLNDVLETLRKKGHDYTGGSADRLKNFREVADEVEIPPEKVWYTYIYKQWAAIMTFVKKGGQTESEPIRERVKDMIVYLLLGYKLFQEMLERKKS